MYSIDNAILEHRPTGHIFEDDFENAIVDAGFKKLKRHIDTDLDINQGTDFTLGSLRIDPTLNFSEKDNMPFIFDTKIPAGAGTNFKIGVRHGNKHKPNDKKWSEHYSEFEQPVAVIGIDMNANMYRMCQYEVLKNLQENADIILAMAESACEDYTTLDPEDRKDLLAEPLQQNYKYREPKNIGPEYKRYNQAQAIFIQTKQDFSIEDYS